MSGVKDEATVKMLEVNGINEVKILSRSNGIPEIKMSNGNGDIKKANGCQDRTQLVLPSIQSIDIVFKDIKYSVSTSLFNKQRKVILDGLSGVFKSGELTAIMGPSGAGKSSLLNVLSGFITTGIEGSVYANDRLLDSKKSLIKRYCAYMQQEDYLNPLFTVKEIMYHAASLKLSKKTGNKARQLLIEDILDSMAMRETCNTRCGQLSGGQKKRLNVCLELINNPSILYLDEPTSGLDSSNCSLLISKLKGLARSGRTVICTIHQPSAALFSQFDHLYLVSLGRTVYQGTTSNILPFLNCVGLTCPVFHNPADFVMDVTSGEFGDYTEKMILESNKIDWRKNDHTEPYQGNKFKHSSVFFGGSNNNEGEEKPSEWTRYFYLMPRMLILLHRDWTASYLKIIVHSIMCVFLGLLFTGVGNNGARVVNNLAFFVGFTIYLTYTIAMPAAIKFPCEMKILKKEHFNNWYKFTTYFFAFLSVHLPLQLTVNGSFMLLTYVLTGQALELKRVVLYSLSQGFVTIMAELFGLIFGTMAHPVNGVFLSSVVIGIYVLLGGFFVLIKDMAPILRILTFFSYFRYIFEIQVLSQYGMDRGKLDCPNDMFYCHFRDTKIIVEDMLELKDSQIWYNFGILSVYTLIIGCFTFLLTRHRLKSFH